MRSRPAGRLFVKQQFILLVGMSSDEGRVRIKQWLLEGLLLDGSLPNLRSAHVRMDPANFELLP